MASPDLAMEAGIDPRMFCDVMGHFATGVTVVAYDCDGQARGMTANAFMSVSLDPPLALVGVRRGARFAGAVNVGDRFGVSFLRESQRALGNHFGGRPLMDLADPFETIDGVARVRDALAWMALRTVAVHEAGDHLLYVGEVERLGLGEERRPLVFYGGAYKQVQAHEPPALAWAGDDGW